MKFKRLGKSGMWVSQLCLGTMNFGPNTEEKEAFRIMDEALDAGINFFDTANTYGARNGGYAGWTEEIIGRWFAQGGNRRERVVLGTKVHDQMFDPLDGPNDVPGLSAYKIRRHLEGSLRRLQTDHVELYQMHRHDSYNDWDELWGAYEALIQQGKIYYAGSSNFSARDICNAQANAKDRHFFGLISEQHKYNLIVRQPELDLLPTAQEQGLGVVVWSPLFGGMLSGKALKEANGVERSAKYAGKLSEARVAQLSAYAKLCDELGETQSDVALAWLMANPAVTAPITGPRTAEQLQSALRAVELVLPDDFLKALDGIFPPPSEHVPEDFLPMPKVK